LIDEDIRKGQDQWARKIVARDNQCQLCDIKEDLQAHHKDGNPQNNSLQNGVTLCGSCHVKMERILENADKFLPSNLGYIGYYRQLAALRRGQKTLTASRLTNPLDLIGLKDSIAQIQQQIARGFITKVVPSDDEIDTIINDLTLKCFSWGFYGGCRFCQDTLDVALTTPKQVMAWFNVRGEKILRDYIEKLDADDSSHQKWVVVKKPNP